jgi:hypothetical protein
MRKLESLLVVPFLVLVAAPWARADDSVKPYATQVTLTLDGAKVGSVHGSDLATYAISNVISEATGGATYPKKHIGNVKYEDFELMVGVDGGKALYDWMAATLQMSYQRKNGVVETSDGRREFFNALLTEIRIPRLDAANNASKGIAVKFAPEYARYTRASGGKASAPRRGSLFSTSSFRFSLDGVGTKGVRRIDELAIKLKVAESSVGEVRDYQLEPAKIELPNIRLYLSPTDAADFLAWHEDFVLKGNAAQDKEKNGSLELLSGKETVVELKLHNVGIFGLRDVLLDGTRALQVDLYVERMELLHKGSAPAAAPAAEMTVSPRKPVPDRIPSGRRTTTSTTTSTTLEPAPRVKQRIR